MARYADLPAERISKAFNAPNRPRCTAIVPASLCVGLRPLPQCKLLVDPDGHEHAGQHSASITFKGLGKIIYRWKQDRKT